MAASTSTSFHATVAPAVPAPDPVIRLRVSVERMVVMPGADEVDAASTATMAEEDVPVLELTFDYEHARYGAGAVAPRSGPGDPGRNRAAEDRARLLLESFGAVEVACLERYVPAYDSRASYVVRVDGDVHGFCSFGAYALPQLRALGWHVDIDESYPYRVLASETPWYASLEPDDARPDWFNLELGVTMNGRRMSLLPALLDLIEGQPDESTLAGLSGASSRFFALPVRSADSAGADDTMYLPVPASRIGRVLEVLRDLYEGRVCDAAGASLSLRREEAGLLVALDEVFARGETDATALGCAPLDWRGQAELRHLGARLHRRPGGDEAPPLPGLKATLRPYQAEGVAWLQHLRALDLGGVLADDMGLGKTLQTIAHLLAEKEAGRLSRPCLVVAPTSLVGGWKREIEKFAPSLSVLLLHGGKRHRNMDRIGDHDVVITTYALLWRDRDVFDEHRFSYVVLDEAQAIKNHRSQAHRAVTRVASDHRLCLTGTPLENHIGELLSLFNFLMPGMLGRPEALRERYRVPIEQGDDARLAELQRRVAPFILRRLKCDVAKDLPPKTEIVLPVELAEPQRELYESIRVAAHADVRRLIRKKGLAASTVPVLDALMKLRQVCCDPRLVRVPAARAVEASAKLEVLLDLVHNQLADGHRMLIFSQFTSMLALISEALLHAGVGHLTLTGSTQNRQAKVDAFQAGRADVFLISLKAGGTGLTLTGADTVVHYDPWWNPAAQAQATDRAYRIGQTRPVFVYNLIVAGSVEERMLQLQDRKRKLASAILGGGPSGGALDPADVDDLFAPLDDPASAGG
ncbi:MAG: DEAD/DEAH box helicase [Myxococcota bacterium]